MDRLCAADCKRGMNGRPFDGRRLAAETVWDSTVQALETALQSDDDGDDDGEEEEDEEEEEEKAAVTAAGEEGEKAI